MSFASSEFRVSFRAFFFFLFSLLICKTSLKTLTERIATTTTTLTTGIQTDEEENGGDESVEELAKKKNRKRRLVDFLFFFEHLCSVFPGCSRVLDERTRSQSIELEVKQTRAKERER